MHWLANGLVAAEKMLENKVFSALTGGGSAVSHTVEATGSNPIASTSLPLIPTL
jgi:hypothetical protein